LHLTTNHARIDDIRRLAQQNLYQILGKYAFERSIPKQDFVDNFVNSVDKFEGLRIENMSKGKLRALMCLSKSDWDSKHFGIGIGKLSHTILDADLNLKSRFRMFKKLRADARNIGIHLVFGRLPLAELRSIHALEAVGARLMDVLLTLRREALEEPGAESRWIIDAATSDDIATLQSIAKEIFTIDHFHSDELLDYRKSSELYSQWISNSYGRSTKAILVAREAKKPVGFVLCTLQPVVSGHVVGVMDLVGTHPERTCKGVGSALVLRAIEWFSSRVGSVYVGTQAANSAAVRLYEECNFRSVFAEATFHLRT